jgi:PucR family transcriptional regulator, purine catabolism regulatory protein
VWRALGVDAVFDSLPEVGAVLAAGSEGTGRTVARARVALTEGQLREAVAGDLVVTTAAALAEEPDALLAVLDAQGVAGLAVRLDSRERLPAELLASADELRLPVVALPEGLDLAAVTTVVLDALLQAQRQRLERVLDIHQRFAQIVITGGGAPEVAATLHGLLGCPVAVVDDDGRPSIVVPSDAVIDLDPASSTTVREPIRAGDDVHGAVVAAVGEDGLDSDGAVAMERAAMGLALRLAQAKAVTQAHERFADLSLEELIAGRGSAQDITERAMTFGWDLNRRRAVLLASIDPPESGPIPRNALNTIAAAARRTLGPQAIVWTRSATIAALLAPDTDDPAERRRIAEALREELDQQLRSVTVSIGVGRSVEVPQDLPRSFTEATRAVDVGRWAKERNVTEVFDQLGIERLLASTPADDLAEFVQHAIGPLVEHDRANGTELVETLAVWLETRNMAEAARRMYVHYNTLKNRLDRIESIIGPVFSDAALALECDVALYVARHYHVREEVAPRGL